MTDLNHDGRYSRLSVRVTTKGLLLVDDDQIIFFFGDDCVSFSNVEDRVAFLHDFKKKIEEAIEKIY